MLANIDDFHDKVILDVGAGSGILSFFAIQAGARKVYAIEASSMAQHCEMLVKDNKLVGQIVVIPGKVEDVTVPEEVDTIISEPMGYMLFNERMLESFLHAKKWLKPGGRMFPTQGDLHIAPFTDEALFMEQQSYDVDIELNIPGTNTKSANSLDLKNPYFRYTGQTPQPPAGGSSQSPSDSYWNSVATGNLSGGNQSSYINGILNGLPDNGQAVGQQGVVQTNLIPLLSLHLFSRVFSPTCLIASSFYNCPFLVRVLSIFFCLPLYGSQSKSRLNLAIFYLTFFALSLSLVLILPPLSPPFLFSPSLSLRSYSPPLSPSVLILPSLSLRSYSPPLSLRFLFSLPPFLSLLLILSLLRSYSLSPPPFLFSLPSVLFSLPSVLILSLPSVLILSLPSVLILPSPFLFSLSPLRSYSLSPPLRSYSLSPPPFLFSLPLRSYSLSPSVLILSPSVLILSPLRSYSLSPRSYSLSPPPFLFSPSSPSIPHTPILFACSLPPSLSLLPQPHFLFVLSLLSLSSPCNLFH
ncbi:CARM1 [Acanthosepion pharaonis]|uniref:type I protein arginine methyltransferase n=1 Tax=Acanthosepion pharaonis TaxID=158019 RepID=A0A812CYR1_ACAPH|nr:CARM1 [Sepia pharaonis]